MAEKKPGGMRISKDGKCIVGYTEIMEALGISKRSAERLAADGVLVEYKSLSGGRKREFDLVASFQAVREREKLERERDSDQKKREALKRRQMQSDIDWRAVRREMDEIKRDRELGKYISIETVRQDYQKFFALFKSFAMGIPGRVGMKIKGKVSLEDQRKIEAAIEKEVAERLRLFVLAAVLPGEKTPEAEKPAAKKKSAPKTPPKGAASKADTKPKPKGEKKK